ncbi:MAG: dipeptide epimerase [Thermoflavifilum sp.]|uniref:mandelate racemase/muconate lactonizing enzyme family protein n=1 Tax=Thermoflavifilum sp. TaxID=1968839 RepID=UPI0018A48FBF|nr:dipeptide epimerase [Thermoflavifilum sp.]QOR76025.1 MAG: dipeptide epimerase [Thermoflavifilum sp.]
MIIQDIQIHKENLGLKRPYTIAYKSVDHVENVVVVLTLQNAIRGWGAANPSKYVVGEDVDDTWKILTDGDRAKELLIGADIRQLGELMNRVYQAFQGHPGALAALDIALHDAFCRSIGVPLVKWLGQAHEKMLTSVTIGIKSVAETLAEAEEYIGMGFRCLKVKLGHSWEEDVARVVKLREKWKDLPIRVDANQGYGADELLKFYQHIRHYPVELIEQPLPADAVAACRQLPEALREKIAVDESLITPDDAYQLSLPPRAAGIFNIKLMKCGGIREALQIATIARQAGISLMWGCNDESIISISAALHTALSCPHTRYLDLDGSFDLARDVVSGGFKLQDGYLMPLLDKAGLGLEPF